MARGLLPLAPIGPAGNGQGLLPMAWLPVGDPEAWKVRLKASGAIALQGAAIALSGAAMLQLKWMGAESRLANILLISLIISNLGLLLASRSDRQAIRTGQAALLCCGNFGIIAAPVPVEQAELLSAQALDMYQRMGREGGNTFVGHRIVNAKRGDLTPSLEAGFRRQRRRARRRGCRPHPAGMMVCWHDRFGTSGPPAVQETHWLEWTPPRQRRLWRRIANQRWEHTWQTVHHRITHNGDFETSESFEISIDVASMLGAWLEKALAQPSSAVVDSARIAGLMDLMICQGDWFAAVRWASPNSLDIDLFLHNDPCQAVKQFMERARGSFGLVVISTTWPDLLVLSSLGQPITVDVDPLARVAIHASESAAINAVLAGHEEA